MDQHYSAFISYKHAPEDIAVASEIQKRLERYHIPAAIRKKTGRDKIGRIFRDREELPITSNLSDSITKALADADYLIVICSSSTKLSTWVPREIDYFLKNHSKKQILTVLVDGEPAEVIPEQLLIDSVIKTASDGTTYEEKVVYEPLSCDFRTGLKEAGRSEIPRLAAALLGVSYDELVRRELQYKRRRNLAIGIPAALALAIAFGYLTWSRQEISKNYQEAQANLKQAKINQSTYLCKESSRLYNEGDRIRAILLALEALPSDANDDSRPLTPIAQSTLAFALDAYRAPGNQPHSKRIKMTAEFAVNGIIKDFFIANNGRFVVIRDSNNVVDVWDTISFKKILTLDKEVYKDVQIFSDTRLAVLTRKGVVLYDILSGQEIWRFEDEMLYWSLLEMKVSSEMNRVWLIISREEYSKESGSQYSLTLAGLEASTGNIVFVSDPIGEWSNSVDVSEIICSADGQQVAVAAVNLYSRGKDPDRLFLVNTETEEVKELLTNLRYYYIHTMRFLEGSRLVVSGVLLDEYSDGSIVFHDLPDQYSLKNVALSCFDTMLGKTLWDTTFECFQHSYLTDGMGLGYAQESKQIVYTYANKTCLIRLADGVIEDTIEYSAPVIGFEHSETGYSIACLINGNIGVYDPDIKGHNTEQSVFDYSNIGMLRFSFPGDTTANYLVVPDNHRIWLCVPVEDQDFVRYKAAPMPKSTDIQAMAQCNDTLAILSTDGCLYFYDLSDQVSGHIVNLRGSYEQYTLIGADEVTETFWVADSNEENQLLCISRLDGSIKKYQSGYEEFYCPKILENGKLFYWGVNWEGNTKGTLVVAEVRDGKLIETPLITVDNMFITNLSIRQDLKFAAIAVKDVCYLVDLDTHDITECQELLKNEIEQMIWIEPTDHTDRLAITDGYEVCILESDGTVITRLNEIGARVVSMTVYQEELVVLYGGGKLTRYALSDGTLKGRTKIAAYSVKYEVVYDDQVEWIFKDGKLYLLSKKYNLMQIIDLTTWETEAAAQDGIFYDAERDRIVCCSEDDSSGEIYLGYFPHYTVENLRRKAQDALHGAELTQEERAMYGLTDN